MTVLTDCLRDIEQRFDVAVLDQYGVLHNGIEPYPFANAALDFLKDSGKAFAILSNSGKRAELNKDRICRLGVRLDRNCLVETSGEACWRDLDAAELVVSPGNRKTAFPVETKVGDAKGWAAGNRHIEIVSNLDRADAVLLMGMPEPERLDDVFNMFERAIVQNLPLICTNPDRLSTGRNGTLPSPGILADRFGELGGRVIWYGKPHPRVFEVVRDRFPDVDPRRILMIGDSMEHDIAGAKRAGWSTAFVRGGIHADEFRHAPGNDSILATLQQLANRSDCFAPDFSLPELR